MPAKSERQINSFIRGLITESSPLTFPENASLDEDNFVLNRDGSRQRRLGMEYEDDYVLNSLGTATIGEVSFHEWKISGGTTNTVIGVVRVYNQLWFIDMLDRSPSTALLNGGLSVTVPFLNGSPLSSAVINNALILVSADLPTPVRVTYDEENDAILQAAYGVLVRDFWGVYDGLIDNERPTVLSLNHLYNLRNQGWNPTIQSTCGTDPVGCTYSILGKYPSNSDIWTVGKVSDSASADFEKYSPSELVKRNYDLTYAPRGKHIIDVFNRGLSRAETSGVTLTSIPNNGTFFKQKSISLSGSTRVNSAWVASQLAAKNTALFASLFPVATAQQLSFDEETGSFTTVASYAGRIFYSGVRTAIIDPDEFSPNYSGYVFFTQTVTSDDKLSKCYQEADPTSENISDLIDTDGGAIQIVDAINITALIPTKNALLVFAENGVWQISGGNANFSATEYDISKVSSVGCNSQRSIVAVNNEVFYWAKGGIFRIVFDDTDGGLKGENLSLTSIQTLYNEIPELGRQYARGVFEEKQNTIRWIYNNTLTYTGNANFNKELVLDLTLGAFYQNSISNSSIYIADYVRIPDYAQSAALDEVVVGVDPVLVGVDEVVVNSLSFSFRESPYSYIAIDPVNLKFTLSKYKDTTFKDWVIGAGGINYSSYLVTGYDIFGEIMRKKYAPYIMFYFDRTEDGYTDVTGTLELTNPSSCLVQAQWNWANSANSGKWGSQFQAYRFNRHYIPSGTTDTFDYGDRVIVTKNRLRGSGRALSIKIQSEEGKDMKLLGWALSITGNTAP